MAERVCIVSVPKSGTHLMVKVLFLLGFVPLRGLMPGELGGRASDAREGDVELGLGRDPWVPAATVERFLADMPDRGVTSTHAPFSQALAAILDRRGVVPVHVLRDPRDVAVSQAHWWADERAGTGYHEVAGRVGIDERILIAARGGDLDDRRVKGVAAKFALSLGWRAHSRTVGVRFEDFVGGDPAVAAEAVSAVAQGVGVALDERRAGQVVALIPGHTRTFRRGAVGSWRDELPSARHAEMDEALGDLAESLGCPR